ncbi:glycerol-3-phosphate 1-O-acyltransferase PlsY [Bordetella genomosp. 4]|uniref:Glycerol-3-phosphate acyltransferase n=1 Tax=Bordetella genomosp. 4 TaxID=463044 RepID=A0A261U3L1_9BORD|nr:glycerol-3-phosphate 1-O-acyltransferase PlsY [Bordetella genomosp. 4]OZI49763.1 glycerol-3-phosphate acyltransferase [Bordetella genomosp. 4]OZI56205.1 glycerol-3-phosphate acyltransferase [Bordetella genomosp. 4]
MVHTAPSFFFSAGLIALAYLIGSIPFAVVVSKLMGLQDPRSYGSKNPGATNVLRTGNKAAAALTLLGDAAKGWFALWLAQTLAPGLPWTIYALVALAVFLGHLYPVFLGFKGGKGVATALGILLAIHPGLALATAATWVIIAVFTRYSSLAALVAAFFAPVYYLFGSGVAWYAQGPVGIALAIISLLLFYRHRANIGRLLSGKESRIGSKKK